MTRFFDAVGPGLWLRRRRRTTGDPAVYREQALAHKASRTQRPCGLRRPRSEEQGGCAGVGAPAGPDTYPFPAPWPFELVGGVLDLLLETADGRVERFEQGQVGLDAAADEAVGDIGSAAVAFALVLDVAGHGGQVGLTACGVDVAIPMGALADEAEAGTEQVAQPAAFFGVGVGRRQVAALEETGDGLGVLAVEAEANRSSRGKRAAIYLARELQA
jgi:hypothetical protein